MKDFAALFTALDQTNSTNAKVAALAGFFGTAAPRDKLWTIALLSGRRPKRILTTSRLREWAAEVAGIPLWLFEEAYPVVGDLAETIALVLPEPTRANDPRGLADWIETLRSLPHVPEAERKSTVLAAWATLGPVERFLFNKLLTGGFRMGISQKLMTRALSQATGIEEPVLAHRLMGGWTPEATSYDALVTAPDPGEDLSRPYPFCLAYQLEDGPRDIGPVTDWAAEWKWDGIRGQIVVRGGQLFTWSRGEELMTDRFPEFAPLARALPGGTVLDGEIVAWTTADPADPAAPAQGELNLGDLPPDAPADRIAPIPGLPGAPLPFSQLQRRIGRKTVPKKLLAEAPARFLAYDLLETGGADIRDQPYATRRAALDTLIAALPETLPISASPLVEAPDWDALTATRATARSLRAEGLMLKRRDAPYRDGRRKGDWWKWKLDPLSVDAIMVYAQSGHGRRANLFTDFTFAVPDANGDLVPFTKAYSGLTDKEFRDITAWVKKNTLQRFGPVRQVPPELVFEIAFEGIQRSPRHKSGIALRFPRMARWRTDKPAAEANTLADLEALLDAYGS